MEKGEVAVDKEGGALRLRLTGVWSIFATAPEFGAVMKSAKARGDTQELVVDCSDVSGWDSRLLVFLVSAREFCRDHAWRFRPVSMPPGLGPLLEQAPRRGRKAKDSGAGRRWFERSDASIERFAGQLAEAITFAGEVTLGTVRVLARPRKFRWGEALEAMQQTGAHALPIVGLISFLVGVIMAYQASIQLRQFGADIFVANLVGLAVVREMGPMMAAVVLCGRTGAAFAAQIGTMKVGEEIDALRTMGASPIDFLVMPRMAALFLMMPLLGIYANFLGIFGGMFVAATAMDILPGTYINQTLGAVGLTDVASGLIKAIVFGAIIAFSGCLRGLQCQRSASGVGAAATSAVVLGILLVIIADALFAVLFDRLGI